MTMTKEQMAEQINARKTSQKDNSKQVTTKTTTNQRKQKNATQDTTDTSKEIERLTKVNERQLKENQKLAEENEKLHKQLKEQPEQDLSVVEKLKSEIESLREREFSMEEQLHDEIKKWRTKFELAEEEANGAIKQALIATAELDVQKSERTLLENQLKNATERIQQLKNYERDYNSLQVDHANLRSRYHSIENDLEEFKGTEALLVGVMERYVNLYSRVDEVTS